MTRRREVDNDLVFGREAIAEIIGTSNEGVTFLHRQGKLPVVRVDRTYLGNRHALEAAKVAGLFHKRAQLKDMLEEKVEAEVV